MHPYGPPQGKEPLRGTPAWLDGDLSLRSRRWLFGSAVCLLVFAFYLYKTCQPTDLTDPEFDAGSLCGSLGSGGKYGSPSERWGLVCLAMVFLLCCCPCFSVADHKEWYEAFPALKRARDRAMAAQQDMINKKRARDGQSDLPLRDPTRTSLQNY
eukprot:m.111758 g.111758  ORF g.111758 m.111758 type:complete len:155 (-) comp10761_c0_seq2:6177-6641(-)